MTSLLQIVKDFCLRQNLGSNVQSALTSQDETVAQATALVAEGVQYLSTIFDFQQLRRRISFSHAGETSPLYGALAVDEDVGEGIKAMIPDTLYCVNTTIPVAGPLTAQEWAAVITLQTVPAQHVYRMVQGFLVIYPQPATADGITFSTEILSSNAWKHTNTSTGAVTYIKNPTADEDVCLLPAEIVKGDLKWRWRAAKGLPYAQEQKDSYLSIQVRLGWQYAQTELKMHGTDDEMIKPGIMIPSGNWNQ